MKKLTKDDVLHELEEKYGNDEFPNYYDECKGYIDCLLYHVLITGDLYDELLSTLDKALFDFYL